MINSFYGILEEIGCSYISETQIWKDGRRTIPYSEVLRLYSQGKNSIIEIKETSHGENDYRTALFVQSQKRWKAGQKQLTNI